MHEVLLYPPLKPTRGRQKGGHGCGQRQALKSPEAPIPLCCNSALGTDNRCIEVHSPPGDPSQPRLGLASSGSMKPHFPPAASMPVSSSESRPRNFPWAPFARLQHLLLETSQAPACFSRVLGCRGSRAWWRAGPDALPSWDRCFMSTSWPPPQKECCMLPPGS